MNTATPLRSLSHWRGDVRLYRLVPPMKDGDVAREFVIVSAVDVPYSGPETYIFSATPDGDVIDWMELEGSYRGGLDHTEALGNAGYTIVAAEGA